MPWPTQTTMDRPKTWQNMHKNFTRLSLKHVRTKANNLRHIKATTRHYMVGMLSMHGRYAKHAWCTKTNTQQGYIMA